MKQEWIKRLDESLIQSFYEQQNEREIEEGLTTQLSFGTAGIRGKFGIGPGRMNAFTVRKVALGLAKFIKANSNEATIVVFYDSRLLSEAFSKELSIILADNGVKVITAESYKSTPELSHAIRYYGADGGVMITASHNPKNYNGIKVYNEYGGQLLPKDSEILSSYIDEIENPLDIEIGSFDKLVTKDQINFTSKDVRNNYINEVIKATGNIEKKNAKTVLTSLHGTSLPIVSDILDKLNYDNYVIAQSQSIPDGTFPTLNSPNPEDESAFEVGKKLAEESDAQLIIATDPDADRLGIVERLDNGEYKFFNGNELGLILMKLRYQDLIDASYEDLYIVKSIVTSELSEKLADVLNVNVYNVLTGFKYISEILNDKSHTNEKLLLAFEESNGYMVEPFVRDKDALQIVPLIIKFKNLLYENNITLKDTLDDIYRTVGHYQNVNLSPVFEGADGQHKIETIINSFRNKEIYQVCGLDVKAIEDYQLGTIKYIESGKEKATYLPNANLIRLIFDEGFIAIRPSGTEPKIKIYFSLNVNNIDSLIKEFQETYIEY
ncbi:phospho-sugar mutase [Staphylococcus capitis]|uniref:phospho-sugar mutase n=1 Tax=Staphylococcus capitis TaxID=29388 RepID=UPI001D148EA3|nr:phospho-sugar mutase [Staphylococcus capitis]MCC3755141.1 phospho-sugar mutase [Staphylococcus capitis]MDH8730006.1 phospho-sugar mutase [Staphylococcus capitis]MDH8923224.1 phospho-sugar mutase [Staphylococcus capitis]MDH8943815.1 phospho-sugar mutase [Staphylococcus capitis]MDH9593316.1 phospho-sugar mutase [Staphylococcus capitis]